MKNVKVNIYCIKDDATGFMSLWAEHNDVAAERQIELLVKKEGTMYKLHPEMYNLYKVGVMDTETGEIEPCMIHIVNGAIYGKE